MLRILYRRKVLGQDQVSGLNGMNGLYRTGYFTDYNLKSRIWQNLLYRIWKVQSSKNDTGKRRTLLRMFSGRYSTVVIVLATDVVAPPPLEHYLCLNCFIIKQYVLQHFTVSTSLVITLLLYHSRSMGSSAVFQ